MIGSEVSFVTPYLTSLLTYFGARPKNNQIWRIMKVNELKRPKFPILIPYLCVEFSELSPVHLIDLNYLICINFPPSFRIRIDGVFLVEILLKAVGILLPFLVANLAFLFLLSVWKLLVISRSLPLHCQIRHFLLRHVIRTRLNTVALFCLKRNSCS